MVDTSGPEVSDWFWDTYLDWTDELRPLLGSEDGEDYQPVFLRLSPDVSARLAGGMRIEQLFAQSPKLVAFAPKFERHERRSIRQSDGRDELYVYVLQSHLKTNFADLEPEFTILDVGSVVRLNQEDEAEMQMAFAQARSAPSVVVGIIDDGIGFLNERFTQIVERDMMPTKKSRFEAVWIQAGEKDKPGNRRRVEVGKVLKRRDINDFFKRYVSEFDAYRELNNNIMHETAHRSTEYQFSHGTLVADLAGGFDPQDEAQKYNLLGVQLPAESIADTSGARFETHLVMGVRWMLDQAREMNDNIVINISLGILAGPKNGSGFAEYQIAREIESWEVSTGLRAFAVFAYGNNYLSNQVAQYKMVESGAQRSIDWVIQPEDYTASYMEIRCIGLASDATALPEDLLVSIVGPGGVKMDATSIAPASSKKLFDRRGALVGKIYHVAARQLDQEVITPAYYGIALAPSGDYAQSSIKCKPGSWQVTIHNESSQSIDVTIQVQRDDDAPGYRSLGRQSYLEDENAHEWNEITQDYSGLGPVGPIVYAGSNSALTTGTSGDSIRTVGSAERMAHSGNFRPAEYTSEGADWSGYTPTDAAIAKEGQALDGVVGSGTFSATTAQMSGTSAAAPQLTRWIAHCLLNSIPTDLVNSQTHWNVPTQQQSRLSTRVLKSSGVARNRRPEQA